MSTPSAPTTTSSRPVSPTSAPTTFGVRTTGPGLDLFRAGLGLNWNLGKGQAAAFGYDYLAGTGVSSAHQIKANYTFRF